MWVGRSVVGLSCSERQSLAARRLSALCAAVLGVLVLVGGGARTATAAGADLALGKVVTVSSLYDNAYPPGALVDGNDASVCITNENSSQIATLMVDLGSSLAVGSWRTVGYNYGAPAMALQSSPDAGTWTTQVASIVSSDTTPRAAVFGSPVTARYWRLAGTSGGALRVSTLNLYAPDPVTTTTAPATTTTVPPATTTTVPPTTTTTVPPPTFAQVHEQEQETLYGMALLIFLGCVHVVGSWGRR